MAAVEKSIAEQLAEAEAKVARLKEQQAKEAFKSYYEVVDFIKEKKIDPKSFISWHRETFKQAILTVDIETSAGKQTYSRYDIDLAAPKVEIKEALKKLGRSTLIAGINPDFKKKGDTFVNTLFNK